MATDDYNPYSNGGLVDSGSFGGWIATDTAMSTGTINSGWGGQLSMQTQQLYPEPKKQRSKKVKETFKNFIDQLRSEVDKPLEAILV